MVARHLLRPQSDFIHLYFEAEEMQGDGALVSNDEAVKMWY